MTRKVTVVTEYWPKPIPVREFDWSAVLDGYDQGDPMGFGPSEADAVADLYHEIEEREAEEEERHEQKARMRA